MLRKSVGDGRTSGPVREKNSVVAVVIGVCGGRLYVYIYYIYILLHARVGTCCAIQSKLLGMKLIVVLWFRGGNRCVRVCVYCVGARKVYVRARACSFAR